MKLKSIIALWFIAASLSIATAKESSDEQVKALNRRYDQVEAQLNQSIRYSKKETAGDEVTIEQAWFNGAGDPIKVVTERITPNNHERVEYVAPDFESYMMFILTRIESPLPDGGTQVDESRKYFGDDGQLLRELRKSTHFKAGQSTDTEHFQNTVVNVAKRPKQNASDGEQQALYDFFSKPEKIAESLPQSGPPDLDPFANAKNDSERFRVIHGSTSPDGRHAIALGFKREKIDWEDFRDKELEVGGKIYTAEEDDRENLLVDLPNQRILGKTGGDYFGTKQHYNYRECVVAWSPDSRTFVQITSNKWSYDTCRAGAISADNKLIGVVDLGYYAEKVADRFLAKHKYGEERGSIAISVTEVKDDGEIGLTVLGQEAGGERKGDVNFSVDEHLRLRRTSSGLQLETIGVRKSVEE